MGNEPTVNKMKSGCNLQTQQNSVPGHEFSWRCKMPTRLHTPSEFEVNLQQIKAGSNKERLSNM